MKKIRCDLGWVLALAIALPPAVQGAPAMIRISDPSICIDGMETAPISDDLEPIMAAVDVGCPAPQGTISI